MLLTVTAFAHFMQRNQLNSDFDNMMLNSLERNVMLYWLQQTVLCWFSLPYSNCSFIIMAYHFLFTSDNSPYNNFSAKIKGTNKPIRNDLSNCF